jgi:hypothetical protein
VAGFKHPVHLCLRVNFFLYGMAVVFIGEVLVSGAQAAGLVGGVGDFKD